VAPHSRYGMSLLKGAPSAYSRAPNFFSVPGPPYLYFNHCVYYIYDGSIYCCSLLLILRDNDSVVIQSEGGNVAVHLAEESHQKGRPFLMPQTERSLVAHGILSRFLKAFINCVSGVFSQ